MENLTLEAGGALTWRDIHRQETDHPVPRNVAACAEQFLFEPVALGDGVTLSDIFSLLDTCAPLRRIFRRAFAEALCAEARLGPAAPSASEADERIEYLELRRAWRLDTADLTYHGTAELDLSGKGPVLARGKPEYGLRAGERVAWAVSLTPLRELLALPLRLRADFEIVEDNIDAFAYARPIAAGRSDELLLGQLIHGVLHELSWHGGPQHQAEFVRELTARKAELDAGTAELVSADELFADYYRAGFDALFETLGNTSQTDVRGAIHRIPDDAPAGDWLAKEFVGRVAVRAAFRDKNGRAFREAFRLAGRAPKV